MSEAIRAAFATQAGWGRQLGAPFTAQLCELLGVAVDDTTAVGRRVLAWPGAPVADALVLRLLGGLHALVRRGELPGLAAHYPPNVAGDGLAAALADALGDDRLLPWLDSAPQTNEVARSAVLMPGLLTIAAGTGLPLALFELGASAGLNLRLDRYRYTFGGLEFGPGDAPLTLAPIWDGPPPPDVRLEVVERRGVDLNPLDVRDRRQRERLLAYVWPDQQVRRARLEAALAAAAADPPTIDRADAADWVEQVVAPVPGRATVVFHSIAFQYFPPAAQARITSHMAAQGARATTDAPLAWLRFEFDDGAAAGSQPKLRLQSWPGGVDRLLAHTHPHGASVVWFG